MSYSSYAPTHFDCSFETVKEDDDTFKVTIYETGTLENYIRGAIVGFWRSTVEGRKCWDSYHEHIEYDKENDLYRFNIQLNDSPEGDTWVSGSVKLGPRMHVEIQEKDFYQN